MKRLIPPIVFTVINKMAIVKQFFTVKLFLQSLKENSPLKNIGVKLMGDSTGDPHEFFNHYCSYSFWAAQKLKLKAGPENRQIKILDIGSPKMMNSIFSVNYDVSSIVLADCQDSITDVNYIYHDVSEPLPFADASFDVLTSTVSLPLIGLARYGDKLDANSLPNLVDQLDRVMKNDADLIISMCLGPNILAFNNGWFLNIDTIQKIFKNWTLIDSLVDTWSSPHGNRRPKYTERFTKDTSSDDIPVGDYNVVFLHFVRKKS